MPANLLYITTSDGDEAARIAETLLAERLIACANVLPKMESFYRWNGELCRDSEVVLIAKTDQRRVEEATARIVALHSYETPCVVALPIAGGHREFLQWIEQETSFSRGEREE